jgi:hypothetical protein
MDVSLTGGLGPEDEQRVRARRLVALMFVKFPMPSDVYLDRSGELIPSFPGVCFRSLPTLSVGYFFVAHERRDHTILNMEPFAVARAA